MRETVLAALSYHDLFDRPLTFHEVRQALPSYAEPAALAGALEALAREGRIVHEGGDLTVLVGRRQQARRGPEVIKPQPAVGGAEVPRPIALM